MQDEDPAGDRRDFAAAAAHTLGGVFALAVIAAALLVGSSETSYRQAVQALQQTGSVEAREGLSPQAAASRAPSIETADRVQQQPLQRGATEVLDTLALHRVAVAALTTLFLLVLAVVLRQRMGRDLAWVQQQQALQAERDRLEAQAAQRSHELTELARHLELDREDERARLARDLHDELGALLTAAKLDVARMRPALERKAPELAARLHHMSGALNEGIALKRRLIEELRPSTLSNLGLLPALEFLCAEWGARTGLQVQLQAQPVALSAADELTVYRLVQEALVNVARHARAHSVQVLLQPEGSQDGVEVRIRDDGVGFEPAQAVDAQRHGLLGLRYRLQAAGGRLIVEAQPGRGTTLRARLPGLIDARQRRADA